MFQGVSEYIYFLNRIYSSYQSDIVPINNYNYNKYYALYQRSSILSDAIDRVISACTMQEWNITSTVSSNRKKNEKYEWEVYNFLKNKGIDAMYNDYILYTMLTGNAYAIANKNNDIIIKDNTEVKVFYDYTNNVVSRYALFENGKEKIHSIPSIYHFYQKQTQNGVCVPMIESIYNECILHSICIEINQQMIGSGNVGTAFAVFEKEMESIMGQVVHNDPQKRTKLQIILDKITDKFSFIKKNKLTGRTSSNNIGALVGLKEFIELGKSNNDMQLMQLVEYLERKIYDRIGIKYTSQESTYANAQTLKYENYENVALPRIKQFEDFVNYYLLKHYKIDADNKIRFTFSRPESPDFITAKQHRLNEVLTISQLLNNTDATLELVNEYRDEYNMSELQVKVQQEQVTLQQPQESFFNNSIQDIEIKKNEAKLLKEYFNDVTPVEKALKSVYYDSNVYDAKQKKRKRKGLLPSFERALTRQVKDFKKLAKDATPEEIKRDITKYVKNLETYYSFDALTQDLFKFVELAVNEITAKNSDIELFAIEDYPKYLSTFVIGRVEFLLKGEERLDTTLYDMILRYIDTADDFLLDTLVEKLTGNIQSRAENIAETEVEYITEGSRYETFANNEYKYKELITVNDDKVSKYCIRAEKRGKIRIDEKYSGSFGSALFPPLHARCRSTVIYYKD